MIETILIIFTILYTLENKPIIILIDFIGIILSISVLLLQIEWYDISLISYILIIIYGSGLAI
jgi:hypothetical protein